MHNELVEVPLFTGLPVLAVAVAVARWHWITRNGRIRTVVAGQLFRSGAMRPDHLLRNVRQRAIRAVIDLRSGRAPVQRERDALAAAGVAHFHVPSREVPDADTVDAVLALLDRRENRPALVHCKHGVQRAALFEAIYRIEYQGWTNERALAALRWRSGFRDFRHGSDGERFLRAYVPRRQSPPGVAALPGVAFSAGATR